MKCDVCSKLGHGKLIPPDKFREAVQGGFSPFLFDTLPKTPQVQFVLTVAQQRALTEWKEFVEQTDTDWNVCADCYQFLSFYI